MLKRVLATTIALVFAGAALSIAYAWETTVHRIPIPGHPTKTVDFVYRRAMNDECGYIVRYGRSETKTPFIPSDVSVDEIKSNTQVEYRDKTLIVHGPQGQRLEVAGYIP